jgi:hypothetical protein
MDDSDLKLEQRLHDAFALSLAEEGALWRHYQGTLPERQGWLAFQTAMRAAQEHIRQAMAWVHRAAAPRRLEDYSGLLLADAIFDKEQRR